MKIAVLSLFPEMFESFLSTSIIGRAREEGLLSVETIDIRPYSDKKHKNTDDYPFGGGAGMVMMAQPIVDAVRDTRSKGYQGRCIYLSPRGKPLCQQKVVELAREDGLILLCGHYEGVDQRAIDLVVNEELSIGDFVLTGGELPAMALIDAVARYVPGVLGSEESTGEESFTDGLLEYPQYTRPREFEGREVPKVLLNGDHAKIKAWRREQSLQITAKVRKDLFDTAPMTGKERQKIMEKLKQLSPEECVFRKALPGEAGIIYAMVEKRVRWMQEKNLHSWNETDYLNVYPLAYYQSNLDRFMVLAEGNHILCAAAILEEDDRWPNAEGAAFYIHHLVSDAEVKGAGRLFWEALENYAREAGKEYLRLDVSVENPPLAAYYERLGFEPCGSCEDGLYHGELRQKRL